MAFSKWTPLVAALCGALVAQGVMADPSMSSEDNKEPSKLVPGYKPPKLKFAPIMGNDIVGTSQNGTPITKLDQFTYQLGREIVADILAAEAEARRRGEKVPERVKRDIWAEREKEIAERRAKYGPETTKKFTIPGTTPEISARIWSPEGRVSKDQDGNTVYETSKEIVTAYTDGTVKIVPREVINIVLTNGEVDEVAPPTTPKVEGQGQPAYQGSLAGVEKGFAQQDMNDAAQILIREGKGVKIDNYFSDMDKPFECPECTNPPVEDAPRPEGTPVSSNFWGKVFIGLFGIQSAHAETFDLEAIVKQGKSISDAAEGAEVGLEENRHKDWAQAEAMQFVSELARAGRLEPKIDQVETLDSMSADQLRQIAQVEAANPSMRDTYIFVSYSLGDDALRDILEYASGKDNVELVMRGIPEDSNLAEGLLRMRELVAEFDPAPNIIIDSMLYRAYDVKAVPTVVRVTGKRMMRPKVRIIDAVRDELNMTEEERKSYDEIAKVNTSEADQSYKGRTVPMFLAKVEGLNNPRWLNEQIEMGHLGDFGNRGYIYPIDEPDIMELMQRRALKVDWQKAKQHAIDNFWNEQSKRFFPMPTAKSSVSRVVDPTFMVAQDIKDLAGNYIAREGDMVNPLDKLPFTDAIVVFNPKRKDEVEVAKLLKARFKKDKAIGQVVWIATEFDTVKGWDGYTDITELLDAPVYLVMPEIIDRWQLKVTPSVITADNNTKKFIVEEIATCIVDPETGVCIVD